MIAGGTQTTIPKTNTTSRMKRILWTRTFPTTDRRLPQGTSQIYNNGGLPVNAITNMKRTLQGGQPGPSQNHEVMIATVRPNQQIVALAIAKKWKGLHDTHLLRQTMQTTAQAGIRTTLGQSLRELPLRTTTTRPDRAPLARARHISVPAQRALPHDVVSLISRSGPCPNPSGTW